MSVILESVWWQFMQFLQLIIIMINILMYTGWLVLGLEFLVHQYTIPTQLRTPAVVGLPYIDHVTNYGNVNEQWNLTQSKLQHITPLYHIKTSKCGIKCNFDNLSNELRSWTIIETACLNYWHEPFKQFVSNTLER